MAVKRPAKSAPGHYRKRDVRRATAVMHDRLQRGSQLGVGKLVVAGVRVAIEARKIRRAYLQSYPVTRLEHVGRVPEVDLEFRHLARCEELLLGLRFPKSRPQDAVRQ